MSSFMNDMGFFQGTPQWTARNIPNLEGKIAIVTGGNTGLGKETCLQLLAHGAKVYLAARSPERAKEAIDSILAQTGKSERDLIFLKMDLSDQSSIKAAAQEFLGKEQSLHLLINNAGVMATPFSRTKDGFELQWGTNVVGHFALTKRLLPILLSTATKSSEGEVRVVNVSSYGHTMAPPEGIRLEDTDLENESTWTRYGQSKLGNILLTNELKRRYGDRGLYALSAHPGSVDTELVRGPLESYGSFLWPITWVTQKMTALTVQNGAITQLYCATSPEIVSKELNGKYFVPYAKVNQGSENARNEELGKKLWDHLEQVARLD